MVYRKQNQQLVSLPAVIFFAGGPVLKNNNNKNKMHSSHAQRDGVCISVCMHACAGVLLCTRASLLELVKSQKTRENTPQSQKSRSA